MGGLTLLCGDEMIDFLAWGRGRAGPSGGLCAEAAGASARSSNDDLIEARMPDGMLGVAQLRPDFPCCKSYKRATCLGVAACPSLTPAEPMTTGSALEEQALEGPRCRSKILSALPCL